MPVRLDIVECAPRQAGGGSGKGGADGRPWISVMFDCANAYQRVFRNADGSAYIARCPKCAKDIRFVVGSGGTPQRQFHVSC